ncbi:AAA family ATPase [Saccharothrix lopnurensis]|uniref:AAA family ATPase n=1 Tax=Saccharothrix lopnurensis TaxID=1670621 RepID=A0ABW1P2Y4_9PSEU
MPQRVLLICGPPCSGKTTRALGLARQDGGQVIDRDLIARALGSARSHMHAPDITARAEREMRAQLDRLAAARTGTAYVVRSLPHPDSRRVEAERLGAEVELLDPGMAECIRRAQLDHRPRGTVAAIRQWYHRAEWPGEHAGVLGNPCCDCRQPAAASVRCYRCCEKLRASRRWRRLKLQVFAEEVECWVCQEYVDQALAVEDPRSRTVDHVWALRDGGPAYERSNCRLAHRACNTIRTNQLRAERGPQLLIVNPYTI